MIRHIPVPSCAVCPFRQYHYSAHECSCMEFQRLPPQQSSNGKNTPIPDWCPLPPHPSFPQQANSHGAGVSGCGGCGNSDPDKRCLGCLHDFGSQRDNKTGVESNESN